MVDKAAPKEVFLIKATGAMKVKELKAAIAKAHRATPTAGKHKQVLKCAQALKKHLQR